MPDPFPGLCRGLIAPWRAYSTILGSETVDASEGMLDSKERMETSRWSHVYGGYAVTSEVIALLKCREMGGRLKT